MSQIRLGDLLIRAGVVTDGQLNAALAEQKQWGGRLGTILVRMGALSEDLLVKALSRQLNIPRAAIGPNDAIVVPDAILARVDRATCERNVIVPIAYVQERRAVQVAVADPFNVVALDDFGRRLGVRVETLLAGETQIMQAIGRVYSGAPGVERAEASMGFMDNSGRSMSSSQPVPVAPPPMWNAPPTSSQPPAPAWQPPPSTQASQPWPAAPPPAWQAPPSTQSLPPQQPPSPWTTSWSPPMPTTGSGPVPSVPANVGADDLKVLADQQLKAVRALVELLVDKGVISRAELAAWLGR